jgi:acyl carrier protein phosphodiesterase
MNFLAHLHLSGNNPNIMLGNFMGDFVKGKSYRQQYEPEIIKGIELHRSIDEFTDSHPVVTESKNRLRPTYRHYSGVIVDVFYDHFLAANWNQVPFTAAWKHLRSRRIKLFCLPIRFYRQSLIK